MRAPSSLEGDVAGLRRHSLLAAATVALMRLVASRNPGTSVLDRDAVVASPLFKSFLQQMNPDDFARK